MQLCPRRSVRAWVRRVLVAGAVSAAVLSGVTAGLVAGPPAANGASAAAAPVQDDWRGIGLRDVRDGRIFTLRDFEGRIVLLHPMTPTCPVCAYSGPQKLDRVVS